MKTSMIFPLGILSLTLAACSTVVPMDRGEQQSPQPSPAGAMMDDESRDDGAVEVDAAMPVPGSDAVEMVASRVITVDTSSWAFSPNAITVKKGESVTLQFSGKSGTHGVSIPKLNVQSDAFSAGNTVSLELPTDTAGTFEFKCKVPCGEGHKDMKGTILIEE